MSAWIIRVPDHPSLDEPVFSRMATAMRHVIFESAVRSVGDFLIAVSSTPAGFCYMPYVDVDAPFQQPTSEAKAIRFGTAAEGGHAITALTAQCGIPALGIHFLQGDFGALFAPQHAFHAIVFRPANRNTFVRAVKETFSLELDGPELH